MHFRTSVLLISNVVFNLSILKETVSLESKGVVDGDIDAEVMVVLVIK